MDLLTRNNMIITKDRIIKALEDKKVICWSDLLVRLELLPLFEKYYKEHKEKYFIMKMQMGKTLMNEVEKILKDRIIKSKDKRIRAFKQQSRLNILAWDSLQSCPKIAKEDIDYIEAEDL